MSRYKIRWDFGEEEEQLFDTYEQAENMARYYQACSEEGAETLSLSNPGDYPYDEDAFERPDYEIIEVES